MRKYLIALLVTALFAFSACSNGTPTDEYGAVCVDPATSVRLENDACEQGDDDYLSDAALWYLLLNSNHNYPGVGQRADKSYFKTSKPKNAVTTVLPEQAGDTKSFKKSKSYKDKFKKSKNKSKSSKNKSKSKGSKSKSSGGKRR